MDFQAPEAYASPEAAVMTRLFVKLLTHHLSEVSYDAELAGLSYNVHNTQSGFQVCICFSVGVCVCLLCVHCVFDDTC